MAMQRGATRGKPVIARSNRDSVRDDDGDEDLDVDIGAIDAGEKAGRGKSVGPVGWSVALILIAGSTAVIAYTGYVLLTM